VVTLVMSWCEALKGSREARRTELLARTAEGEPLTRITREATMPARSTVYEWIESDAAFALAFRVARMRGVHALADQCLEIADTPATTAIEVSDKRVRIDTRMRLMAKWLPGVYGDKVTAAHVGPDGGPLRIETRIDMSRLTDEQLAVLASIPIQ
jgi:hypothetical protein